MGKDDNIEIQYRKKTKAEKANSSSADSRSAEDLRAQILQRYQRVIRIVSIFTIFLSIFIFLAIISYSPKDEFVFGLTLKDYFEALKGTGPALGKIKEISNWLGPVGALVSNFFINKTFGFFSITLPILLLLWSVKLLITQNFRGKLVNWTVYLLLFSLFFTSLLGAINLWLNLNIPYYWVGLIGTYLATMTSNFIGLVGAFIFYLFALSVTLIFAFDISVEKYSKSLFQKIVSTFKSPKPDVENKSIPTTDKNVDKGEQLEESKIEPRTADDIDTARILLENFDKARDEKENKDFEPIESDKREESFNDFEDENFVRNNEESKPTEIPRTTTDYIPPSERKLTVVVEETETSESNGETSNKTQAFSPISTLALDEKIRYTPPPIDLLIDDESKFQINEEELKLNARLLQEKLETFKIYIENLTVTPGPVVTLYEFVPAPGIKLSRIQSLADDIALGLKAKGIRIIAPVPGKGTVGIEIPNRKPLVVRFGNCLKNARVNPNYRLPIILGKTISGEVFVEDLARMPHLLIAGATGSGKSVGINTIIASLIYKMHPKNLKFVIIDPKKVELTHYQQLLYHYLAVSPEIDDAIITEPSDAVLVLKALVAEMESRYDILHSVQQKNIVEYNKKVQDGLFKNDPEFEHRQMPYIVTIIDELADLMLTTGKEIEALIIRLAQLARAVGIHLVVATQRPSVDIITGLIKANFPARIAYLVASKVDSRTIIDTIGAEQLLGNGDMLFLPNGSPHPIRIQNAFLTTEEIERICEFIGNQKGFSKPYYLPSVEDNKDSREDFDRSGFDTLFVEAARLIVRYQQASASMLQRRLKIGYNRAGRIMDELERVGIVGPLDGSKGRSIKISSEEELEKFLREKGIL